MWYLSGELTVSRQMANPRAGIGGGLVTAETPGTPSLTRSPAVPIAVAPIVGSARVVSAGGKVLGAPGSAIAVAETEMAEDDGP